MQQASFGKYGWAHDLEWEGSDVCQSFGHQKGPDHHVTDREPLALIGLRCDVAITHRSHRDTAPVKRLDERHPLEMVKSKRSSDENYTDRAESCKEVGLATQGSKNHTRISLG